MTKKKAIKNVVIIGNGGHARVLADVIISNGDKIAAFLDYNANSHNDINNFTKSGEYEFVIAIGDAAVRERIASQLKVKFYTAVHSSAIVSPSAEVGEGTVVMPNAVINAHSKIGKHCIINTGAIVEHDNVLADYVHISVGAKLGGTVAVGKSSMVGIGAAVKNNITICNNCLIGAGAAVVKDITKSGVYAGVPARLIKNIGE